jgi:hypothetical protein
MICESLLRILAQEHKVKKIEGEIITLGRQTIALTLDEALIILRDEGVDPSEHRISEARKFGLDHSTRYGKGAGVLTDKALFALFGDNNLVAMDVSTYENAEIIHNLNYSIETDLENRFDFIIDGGTFDHLFDLKTAFSNLTKMLKVSGRAFMWNGASNFTGTAYMSYAPDFFRDYFLINKYADCKAYLAEVSRQGQFSNWNIFEYMGGRKFSEGMDAFHTPFMMMTIIIAEKGAETTHDMIPVQCFYRDDDKWQDYLAQEAAFKRNGRASLKGNKRLAFFKFFPRLAIFIAYMLHHRRRTKVYRYIGEI